MNTEKTQAYLGFDVKDTNNWVLREAQWEKDHMPSLGKESTITSVNKMNPPLNTIEITCLVYSNSVLEGFPRIHIDL